WSSSTPQIPYSRSWRSASATSSTSYRGASWLRIAQEEQTF
ncbi:hypothetical protein AVDCRST_MAG82-2966, partial [uncultured Rubrobacteraceae bacterium]